MSELASEPTSALASEPLAVLSRLRRQPAPPAEPSVERCEMCTADVGEVHSHVVDLEGRNLLCTCRPCYLLFTASGAGGGRYRCVPDRWLEVTDLALAPGQWEGLQLPVGIAFLFRNSTLDRVSAFYPSPAGATESLLPLEAWEEVAAASPVLASLEPDVEAVLFRVAGDVVECFIVPIDACYELVGRLRKTWRGFDGGQEARASMAAFFDGVVARARR